MQHISYKFFVAILLFAPLAFASVETWSIALVEVLIFLTVLVYFFESRRKAQPPLKVPGFLPIFLLLLFMWGQLIPLPPSLVNFIAPGIYLAYAPIIEMQGYEQWIPLTVNQKSTLLEALRITSYTFFYILTVQLLSRKKLLRKTIKIIVILATSIAALAILQKFTSPSLMYWFRPAPTGSQPMGPWVSYNHYAGFMELIFPLILALFFYYRPSLDTQQPLRSKVVTFLSSPTSNIYVFLGCSVVLVLASIFVALSRGGMISATLALLFFLILLSRKGPSHGKAFPLLFFFGAILLTVGWFGWEPILMRFNNTTSGTGIPTDGRFLLWLDCLPLAKDFLITGSGFGTFSHTFPQYKTSATLVMYTHAHNDYLELLTDGGVIGFLLAACFVITVCKNGFSNLVTRREPYSILLIIGGLTGILSLLIHSFVDFNMHNGANGLYFFFLCGILVSAGNTRMHYRTKPSSLENAHTLWQPAYLIALPLLALTITIQGGILKAKQEYKKTSSIYLNSRLSEDILQRQLSIINNTIQYDQLEGLYLSHKGTLLSYLQQNEAMLENYLKAATKDPQQGAYLQRIGLTLPQNQSEYASRLMEEGYKRSLQKEQFIFIVAEWYLHQSKRQKAIVILQQALEQFPNITKTLHPFLLIYKFKRDEISSILFSTPSAWIGYGAYLDRVGHDAESTYYRTHALEFIDQEKDIKAEYFLQLFRFHRKHKRMDKAANTLQLGIKLLPYHAIFHIYLGDYYKQKEFFSQAQKEYKEALILEPDNKEIRSRLQNIKRQQL